MNELRDLAAHCLLLLGVALLAYSAVLQQHRGMLMTTMSADVIVTAALRLWQEITSWT